MTWDPGRSEQGSFSCHGVRTSAQGLIIACYHSFIAYIHHLQNNLSSSTRPGLLYFVKVAGFDRWLAPMLLLTSACLLVCCMDQICIVGSACDEWRGDEKT